ncbi:hypothetical protein [Streptomyces buecherae]|uniref:hypothetical protein n=1 Tax=Streptomyces buecherae TaxID=2763006 RepID=UPI00164E4989|nr:hypothetical protein [Streptomyces buecherae]
MAYGGVRDVPPHAGGGEELPGPQPPVRTVFLELLCGTAPAAARAFTEAARVSAGSHAAPREARSLLLAVGCASPHPHPTGEGADVRWGELTA